MPGGGAGSTRGPGIRLCALVWERDPTSPNVDDSFVTFVISYKLFWECSIVNDTKQNSSWKFSPSHSDPLTHCTLNSFEKPNEDRAVEISATLIFLKFVSTAQFVLTQSKTP